MTRTLLLDELRVNYMHFQGPFWPHTSQGMRRRHSARCCLTSERQVAMIPK